MTKLRGIGLCTLLAVVFAGACQANGDDGEPTAEKQHALSQEDSFVDRDGRRWTRVGPITYSDATMEEVEAKLEKKISFGNIDIASVSEDEAVRLLRPRTAIGDVEFTLDDNSTREFVRAIQAIARERREDDAAGRSGAPGSPLPNDTGGKDGIGRTQQSIVVGTEDRVNISSLADTRPFRTIGAISIGCTCHKLLNQHTCITAAHCVHDGTDWITRGTITFQAGSSSPLTALPAGCYARTVPGGWDGSNRDFDYAVLALRGFSGAWCAEADYSVGWMGWNTVGDGESNIPTWVAGYPSPPPSGWAWPALVYDKMSNTFQPTAATNQIEHRVDTSGGQSGSAVVQNWSAGGFRSHGVHWGTTGSVNRAVRMTSALTTWMDGFAGF